MKVIVGAGAVPARLRHCQREGGEEAEVLPYQGKGYEFYHFLRCWINHVWAILIQCSFFRGPQPFCPSKFETSLSTPKLRWVGADRENRYSRIFTCENRKHQMNLIFLIMFWNSIHLKYFLFFSSSRWPPLWSVWRRWIPTPPNPLLAAPPNNKIILCYNVIFPLSKGHVKVRKIWNGDPLWRTSPLNSWGFKLLPAQWKLIVLSYFSQIIHSNSIFREIVIQRGIEAKYLAVY